MPDSNPATPFGKFMAAIQRPMAPGAEAQQPDPAPTPASPLTSEALNMVDFDEFSNLVEAEYAQIMVAVPQAIVTAHQTLVDWELQHAESGAMREYWAARRAPNMHDGVPSLPLGDALEAYDFIWAEKNAAETTQTASMEKMYSPRCNRYYDAIAEMLADVWQGRNADYHLKALEHAHFSPNDADNVVIGKHTATETAANLLDFAHATRVDMKGPNRGF